MEKKVLYIARKIDQKGLDILSNHSLIEVRVNPKDEVLSKEELAQNAKGAHGLVTLLTDKVDDEVMEKIGPQLKIIANYAVGFDNIDVKAAQIRNVIVTNTPEVMTQAVAEHAMGLMLSCARRIVEGDRYVRAKKYKGWEPELLLGPEIAGKTLGIVGIGRIGAALAYIGYHGFGMKIIYSDLCHNEEVERNLQAKHVGLTSLLEQSDFISLHVPLCPSTHHMIGSAEFKKMKKNAILINTARGAIIDEKALGRAIASGEILAAGIDVFENEKTPKPSLLKLDRIVFTPHIASATHEARVEMSKCVAENIVEVFSGKLAKTPVVKT